MNRPVVVYRFGPGGKFNGRHLDFLAPDRVVLDTTARSARHTYRRMRKMLSSGDARLATIGLWAYGEGDRP